MTCRSSGNEGEQEKLPRGKPILFASASRDMVSVSGQGLIKTKICPHSKAVHMSSANPISHSTTARKEKSGKSMEVNRLHSLNSLLEVEWENDMVGWAKECRYE